MDILKARNSEHCLAKPEVAKEGPFITRKSCQVFRDGAQEKFNPPPPQKPDQKELIRRPYPQSMNFDNLNSRILKPHHGKINSFRDKPLLNPFTKQYSDNKENAPASKQSKLTPLTHNESVDSVMPRLV